MLIFYHTPLSLVPMLCVGMQLMALLLPRLRQRRRV